MWVLINHLIKLNFHRRIPGPQILANNSKAKKQKRRLGQEDNIENINNNSDIDNSGIIENTDSPTILVDVTASDPFPFTQNILTVD